MHGYATVIHQRIANQNTLIHRNAPKGIGVFFSNGIHHAPQFPALPA